jgi:hypothetical protein
MRPVVLTVACLLAAACGPSGGKSQGPLPMCTRPAAVVEGGPGACTSAPTVQLCQRPDGRSCVCASDSASCPGCGPADGARCQNLCNPNEYGARCGPGAGGTPPDGSIVVVYDDPPPGCLLVARGIGVPSTYCCPCQ